MSSWAWAQWHSPGWFTALSVCSLNIVVTSPLKRTLCCLIATLSMLASPLHANEVTQSYKGLTLNANLVLAADKKVADGVIVITHAGLANRDMELYVHLQKLFKERGYSTLAINLSLARNNRHGMYDCKLTHRHRYTDAADEIGAWTDWLVRQGTQRVILLGHSRGGAETALYAAERDKPQVKAVILLAPDTRETNDAIAYQAHYKKPLAPILNMASRRVRQGRDDTLLKHVDFLYCPDTSTTADTFVSYYGPDPRLDTAYLLPKIRKPVLLVLAGSDEVVVNNLKFASLVDTKQIPIQVIEGADHFFRDLNADDAVDAIDAFLRASDASTR
jgi:pimeloyl-ACP methyl ester carboxylesterase